MRHKDFFCSYNIEKCVITELDCSGLYNTGSLDSVVNINTQKPLVEDDYFHGLEISLKDSVFSIKNDLFCTVPVYYAVNNDLLFISSNPAKVLSKIEKQEIDHAGLWESILFSNCVFDRTPVKQLKQLPSMHQLIIVSGRIKVNKYFKIDFHECKESEVESVIEDIHIRLHEIFSKFKTSKYLIGVSGGLDSRLSLGYLNNSLKISPFTFCATENSLELKLSKQLCSNLGFTDPVTFLLSPKNYLKHKESLANFTAGQIGFHHSHILHCLSELNTSGSLKQISNYFTDAIFGWAVNTHSSNDFDSWSSKLKSVNYISDNVKEEIFKDINNVFADYSKDENFSCKDEYKYIFERNQKFHINLAFQQNRLCDTYLPYCDYRLLKLVLSLPLGVRSNKRISELLISKCGVEDVETISSRQMITGQSFSQKSGIKKVQDNLSFKATNGLTLLISKLTRGNVIYPNKYQCEAHYNLFHKIQSKGLIEEDLNFLEMRGILSTDQKKQIKKVSIRNGGVSSFFQLHSLVNYLRHM